MKFSVFTVMVPELTPEELLVSLKEFGYDGVEWRCKETPEQLKQQEPSFWGNNLCTISPSSRKSQLEQVRSKTKELQLETISVNPYLSCEDLAETEKVLKVAQELGATMMRVGVPTYDRSENYNHLFKRARRYLHEVEEMCQQYQIKGLVETHHKTITPSASLAHRLVDQLNPEYIGVLYDPGNMVFEGYENHRMGLELLGPYLAHVHMKNAKWETNGQREDSSVIWDASWVAVEKGVVDWKQVVKDLQAVGYEGYIGMEDFSGTFGAIESLKQNIEYIKQLVIR
ncbi:sugar phosphate isomerase/epimerase family protein [Halalkalibacter kiskunsagensis]|uniref:Sugar phosphate isomerase/epimerase family protein n=1 Tax=Halalkalibacter kiskunsagensis TaxID=1548599 RepID=A0ABV6KI69_9BACI